MKFVFETNRESWTLIVKITSTKSSSVRGTSYYPAMTGSFSNISKFIFCLPGRWVFLALLKEMRMLGESKIFWYTWSQYTCCFSCSTHWAIESRQHCIKRYDIDILIIMLSNTQKFSQTDVWLGLDYSKSHTFINVTGTTDKMNSIQALPGVCIFIGCNYTPVIF